MYHVSRSLYRHLVPYMADDASVGEREVVLERCEEMVERIFDEPHFARPARFLFHQVRPLFPIEDQICVRRLIDVHVALARELRQRTPVRREHCAAFSRKGEPCRREPKAGRVYCPSHGHLEEPAVADMSEAPG